MTINTLILMHCEMPQDFKTILSDAVKIVNFIKVRLLNSWLFSMTCEETVHLHNKHISSAYWNEMADLWNYIGLILWTAGGGASSN